MNQSLRDAVRPLLVCSLGALFSGALFGVEGGSGLESQLQTQKPQKLKYFADVNQRCGIDRGQVSSVVERAMRGRGLQPVHNSKKYFSVELNCLQAESPSAQSYFVRVAFGRWDPKPAVIYQPALESNGSGKTEDILAAVDGMVSEALDVYRRANGL